MGCLCSEIARLKEDLRIISEKMIPHADSAKSGASALALLLLGAVSPLQEAIETSTITVVCNNLAKLEDKGIPETEDLASNMQAELTSLTAQLSSWISSDEAHHAAEAAAAAAAANQG